MRLVECTTDVVTRGENSGFHIGEKAEVSLRHKSPTQAQALHDPPPSQEALNFEHATGDEGSVPIEEMRRIVREEVRLAVAVNGMSDTATLPPAYAE